MTYFLKSGTTFRPSDEANLDLHTALPAGNYIIKQDQFGNMFFELVDSFEFKSKRYAITLATLNALCLRLCHVT